MIIKFEDVRYSLPINNVVFTKNEDDEDCVFFITNWYDIPEYRNMMNELFEFRYGVDAEIDREQTIMYICFSKEYNLNHFFIDAVGYDEGYRLQHTYVYATEVEISEKEAIFINASIVA